MRCSPPSAADPQLAEAEYQLSLVYARLGDEATAQHHVELYRQKLRGRWNRPLKAAPPERRRQAAQADEGLAALLVAAWPRGAAWMQPRPRRELLFRDITREAGITFAASRRPGKEIHRRIDERRRGARSTSTTTGCRTSISSTR